MHWLASVCVQFHGGARGRRRVMCTLGQHRDGDFSLVPRQQPMYCPDLVRTRAGTVVLEGGGELAKQVLINYLH